MTTTAQETEYLTVKRLAAKFGISDWAVYRGIANGWPCSKPAGYRFSPEQVATIEDLIRLPSAAKPKAAWTDATIARAVKKTGGARTA
jgi:hypothetical protein